MKQIDFIETYHHNIRNEKKRIRLSLTKINDDCIDKDKIIFQFEEEKN